jgi:DNA-binding PadR family transcriptional regulator
MPGPRKPHPLQVLLLVLVKYGLSTPYEVQSSAGMSVGLTLGPLKRLQETGLLACETGTRNKLQYTLTPKGNDELRAALEDGKKDWWFTKFGIFESVPRAILLSWLSSDLENAPKWLGHAIEDLLSEANTKEREAEDLQRKMQRIKMLSRDYEDIKEQGLFIATTYRWMKTVADAALLRAQADLVRNLMPVLLSLSPAPPLPEHKPAMKTKQQRKAANSI